MVGSALLREMDLKTIAFLALVVAACAGVEARFTDGDVRVFNLIGDAIAMNNCYDFSGRNIQQGNFVISPNGYYGWRFQGEETRNRQWACHFQWTDSSDCGGGRGCRVHTRDVRLWETQGYSAPCIDCVWSVQVDGFYRRDGQSGQPKWQFVFGWE